MPAPPDSPAARRATARRRLARASAIAVVLAGLAGYGVIRYEAGVGGHARCTVTDAAGGEWDTLQPQQAANAATIQAVGSSRALPERAMTIAIATAMQESSLRNVDYGDRDSLGLFQQRPSMGWGSAEQVMDPVYASGQFYDHLVEVPDYLELPLTVAAQEVQRSAFPDEYAKHEPRAARLSAALSGRVPAALSCTSGGIPQQVGDAGEVVERLTREFGESVAPGADGGNGVVIPVSGQDARRGWELAHWAVAHAAELGIASITYDGRVWDAAHSASGWQRAGGSRAVRGSAAGAAADAAAAVGAAEAAGPAVELRLASAD